MNTNNSESDERRQKPRITCNFPAVVLGYDERGSNYEENAQVVNMSRGGAYALSRLPLQSGDVLTMRIAFSTGSLQGGAPKISTKAVVRRSELKNDGVVGIAVEFINFKFI